jgi:hypothetical protein
MKRVLFTCLLAIALAAAVIVAGCSGPQRTISPTTSFPTTPPVQSVTVPYGEDVKITLDAPATTEVYLTMTARADSRNVGGGFPFMRITVNGKSLTSERLVNKKLNFTYAGGFKTTYYSANMSAWYLFFSPNFTIYDNPAYNDHILDGNAYLYKFDVSDIVNRGVPNEIVLENIGNEVAAKYSNPSDIEFYKSAPIIVNPILLEGKGGDVVRITKEAAPIRLIIGKKSTVNITLRNDLPGTITDIEIADADLPAGLSGQPLNGKLEKTLASGESYTISYDVTAEKAGSYTLGAASATFADSTGNYQKISSGTVALTVIS